MDHQLRFHSPASTRPGSKPARPSHCGKHARLGATTVRVPAGICTADPLVCCASAKGVEHRWADWGWIAVPDTQFAESDCPCLAAVDCGSSRACTANGGQYLVCEDDTCYSAPRLAQVSLADACGVCQDDRESEVAVARAEIH